MKLTEALRTIAERTAFRTEEEGRAVLAVIDDAIAEEENADRDPEPDDATEHTDPEPDPKQGREQTDPAPKAAGRRSSGK